MTLTVLLIWIRQQRPWRCSPSRFVTHKINEMHFPPNWGGPTPSRLDFKPVRCSCFEKDWPSRAHSVIPTNTAQLFRGWALETQTHRNLSGKVLRWLVTHSSRPLLWRKDVPNVAMLHLFEANLEGRVVYDTALFKHMWKWITDAWWTDAEREKMLRMPAHCFKGSQGLFTNTSEQWTKMPSVFS